jgi:GxxExxY protein
MIHEELTDRILACAIEVHRRLGPGLLESNYMAATAIEFAHAGLGFVREPTLSVRYRDVVIGYHRPDFIVGNLVVVELKSVDRYDPVFAAQVLTYLKIANLRVGLLLNFNRATMSEGIKRFLL